nr:NAD-dependent epimerase/dehydratase family protein [Acuticoccus mangrovi]
MTGGAGLVGPYVADRLATRFPDRSIVRTVRYAGDLRAAPDVVAVDLADAADADRLIRDVKPSLVVHLAGASSVALARTAPSAVWHNNRDAAWCLARAIGRHAPEAVVLFSSTAEVYGASLNLGPASEDTPPLPRGPYPNSKRAAEVIFARDLPESSRLIVARPFNHTGPGQTETFVVPAFAAQLARIEKGLIPPRMVVGNLETERDFLDVRDVADAYVRLLAAAERLPRRLVVNIARGEAVRIRDILDRLVALSGLDVTVSVDPARVRPNEVPRATARTDRLTSLIDWHPSHSLDETLQSVLDDQRARIVNTS